MFKRTLIGLLGLCVASIALAAAPKQALKPLLEDQQHFIHQLAQEGGMNQRDLHALFSKLTPNQTVLDIESKPYAHKTWHMFSTQIVSPARIAGGLRFMKKHHNVLMQAQHRYGVSPYVITAIIGIESSYDGNTGTYSALRSLYTLAFYFPRRSTYFKKELKAFLLLTRKWPAPIQTIKSSFDGGLGIPQFMPSTYRHYAVSYSGQGVPNLIDRPNDAIFSVAHYLQLAHWRDGQVIAASMYLGDNAGEPHCDFNKGVPLVTLAQLRHEGFIIPSYFPNVKVACASLDDDGVMKYWVTAHNFKSIMRYNPHIYYAMVVYQIAHGIEIAEHQKRA